MRRKTPTATILKLWSIGVPPSSSDRDASLAAWTSHEAFGIRTPYPPYLVFSTMARDT